LSGRPRRSRGHRLAKHLVAGRHVDVDRDTDLPSPRGGRHRGRSGDHVGMIEENLTTAIETTGLQRELYLTLGEPGHHGCTQLKLRSHDRTVYPTSRARDQRRRRHCRAPPRL
jgi:hypothetical protein